VLIYFEVKLRTPNFHFQQKMGVDERQVTTHSGHRLPKTDRQVPHANLTVVLVNQLALPCQLHILNEQKIHRYLL